MESTFGQLATRVAVGACMGLALSVPIAASPASASTACMTQNYHVQAEDNDSSAYHTSGIRGDTWVPSAVSCQRVSSFAVWGPNNSSISPQFVEWGHVIGNTIWGTYESTPQLFLAWSQYGQANPYYWTNGANISTTEQLHNFSLQDTNLNTGWGGYYEGAEKYPVDVDFWYGDAITNGERKNTNDRGRADFLNLDEFHEANAWSNFDNVGQNYDNDPDYKYVRVSADSTTVRAG